MERNINSLKGLKMAGADGEIGSVVDFYFDDTSWTIRYLVVHTGSWLFGRKVLISPEVLDKHYIETGSFPVQLTMEQISNSPDIDSHKPVSRQQEMELQDYYQWQSYWSGTNIWENAVPPADDGEGIPHDDKRPANDVHLRSTSEIMGYRLHATDDEIGYVDDYLVDTKSWKIHFLVLDIRKWLDSRKVLISVDRIKKVDFETGEVFADLSTEAVKNSPEHI